MKVKLDKLVEVEEAINNCEGEKESVLCSYCRCTDYGDANPYGQTNGGYWSCEGNGCEEAEEYLADSLLDEYKSKKEENNMEGVKMKIDIDLDTLEKNIVKMATEKIEDGVIDIMVSKLEKSLSEKIDKKVNELLIKKMNDINIGDMYNIKVNTIHGEVNLFEHLVCNMVKKANELSMNFNKTVEELTTAVSYNKIDDKFKSDEFKVLIKYGEDEYGSTDSIEVIVNGVSELSLYEGEVEDMTFNRNLNDALNIPSLIEKAYIAGKSGKIMYIGEEVESNEE